MSARWALAEALTAPPREVKRPRLDPNRAGRNRVLAQVFRERVVAQVLGETRAELPEDLDSILLSGGEDRLDGADLVLYVIEDAAGKRAWWILDAEVLARAAVAQGMVEAGHARLIVPAEALL